MTRFMLLCGALLTAIPASAQGQAKPTAAVPVEQAPPDAAASPADPANFDLARKKVVDCEGEKFVFAWGAGARPTRVTLCSDKGATSDEIVAMLEEAATKLEQTTSLPEDRRTAIVNQIRAKIVEVKSAAASGEAPAAVAEAPASNPELGALSRPSTSPRQPAPEYSVAPPIVPRATAPTRVLAIVPRPDLSFECITPGETPGGGPCVTLTRDTVLIVESGEALRNGVALRYVRQGDSRAEVALGSMRKGQSLRLRIPRQVCSGVLTSEVEIEILSGGRLADSVGPYLLRC